MKHLYWNIKTTPTPLRTMLNTLSATYPISKTDEATTNVTFIKNSEIGLCEVIRKGVKAEISYSTPAQACRAVGALLGNVAKPNQTTSEETPFTMLGIMLDCSRNAVMTVDHTKVWLQKLALLGYNTVMLYTEETYELPGEPWFGYKRGAYSAQELKAIDNYANKLNIEIIPCIQTLGHLEHLLKHKAYNDIKDTSSVMLVGEKKTYELIEKIIIHWKKSCRTNRIHIGMDETHDLGLGRYLDKNGFKDGFTLFNEHLTKVVEICKRHDLKPIIWSDMYFRLGCNSRDYYDTTTVIPKSVIKKIPAETELVYWDYYHKDKAFYLDWIERHRKMGKEPLMASGIWTWNKYWYDHELTVDTAGPCIDACYESKLKELLFTQWGDNGAYCDHDSAFAGMTYCADKAYGNKVPDPNELSKRFLAICKGSYEAHILASGIHNFTDGFFPNMWEDPIFESNLRAHSKNQSTKMKKVANHYKQLAKKLKRYRHDNHAGSLSHAYQLAHTFALRYELAADLFHAYKRKDKVALRKILRRIPKMIETVGMCELTFRTMWMSHNKPEGLETIQARFGMLEVRYRELERRLAEYLDGSIKKIAELEYKHPER
ncbi:MAG: family 20 glycosylhydrolase [Kiritimatiellae bacterium]|nr:family 20 glycosylhydrolase [Kiritimatiellia bacterium]